LSALAAVLVCAAACHDEDIAPPDGPSSAWGLGPALPRPALEPGVALLGQQIVVAGGFDTGVTEGLDVTAEIDAFDSLVHTWGRLPDAPVRWTAINLATLGETLYLLGGLDAQSAAHGEAFELDASTQRWVAIAAMAAGDERGAAGVVTTPGHIYLVGGIAGGAPLATCLEYDITTNTWSHLPDLPAPRAHPAVMWTTDGILILAGGFESADASVPRGDVWALAPAGSASRVWQPRTAMVAPADPDLRGGCAYGVVFGELVCAGGGDAGSAKTAVAGYDPYLDVWTPHEAMPVARAGTQGTPAGGRLFVPGGSASAALEPTDTLYVYSPLDTMH
jgi:hypothetical protein